MQTRWWVAMAAGLVLLGACADSETSELAAQRGEVETDVIVYEFEPIPIAAEILVAPEDRLPYVFRPRPPGPMRPAPPNLVPDEFGPERMTRVERVHDALIPDVHAAPAHGSMRAAPADRTPVEVAPVHSLQQHHPVVGPKLYHDPTPTEMAPISPDR